jgi:undecaprenyl-diphosphatase
VTEVVATLRILRAGPRVTLHVDRRPVDAWLVYVGNGCYGPGVGDGSARERIDDHVLDLRIVRAAGRWARLRLLRELCRGRAGNATVERRTCRSITIDVRTGGLIEIVLDTEPMTTVAPLQPESDAGCACRDAPTRPRRI